MGRDSVGLDFEDVANAIDLVFGACSVFKLADDLNDMIDKEGFLYPQRS